LHKDSITVAHASDDGPADPVSLGTIGTRQCDVDALLRKLQSKGCRLVFVYEAGPCPLWLLALPLSHRQGPELSGGRPLS
jgi:hypothetical protein